MTTIWLLIIISYYGTATELSPQYRTEAECKAAGEFLKSESTRLREFTCLPAKINR